MRLLFFTLFLALIQLSSAQNCFSGWKYFRTVSVNNPSSTSLNDIQIPIYLDTKVLLDSAKLQINGADLRVTDENCSPLPFYVGISMRDSVEAVWVKLPSLPANDTVLLQVYYGNDTASVSSNGDETFLFFDDFSADTVNTNKWEAIGSFATFEVADGVLEYGSDGMNPGPRFKFARTKAIFSEEVIFDFNAQISNSNGFGFSSSDTTLDRILFRQSGFGFDTMNQVAFLKDTLSNGFSINQVYPLIRFPRGEFRDASIRAGIQNNILTLTHFANLNDSSINADTFAISQAPMAGFHFILSSFIERGVFLDYLRVRKPYPDTISTSLGIEETIIQSSISFPGFEAEINLYPNPSTDFIMIEGLEPGDYSFKLINLQGQKVFSSQQQIAVEKAYKISLPTVPSALYYLLITDNIKHKTAAAHLYIQQH